MASGEEEEEKEPGPLFNFFFAAASIVYDVMQRTADWLVGRAAVYQLSHCEGPPIVDDNNKQQQRVWLGKRQEESGI